MGEKKVDRRGLLRAATAATAGTALGSAIGTATPASAAPGARRGRPEGSAATFRWLGTSGWRIDIGARTVLVDPYLTRFPTGLARGQFDPTTRLTVDAAAIAAHAGRPETVLVTHSHWDHFNDVPHIAKTFRSRVVGTVTTVNLALAFGVEAPQLSQVKGGEVFDFGGYTVEVIASLHSRTAGYTLPLPGTVLARPKDQPAIVADLPEGDTLAFQVAVDNGPTVFFMGASDFVARNLTGLRPDVAMIAVPNSDATHAYVPRLIDALGRPSTVVPVHWDNIEVPLANPPLVGPEPKRRLDALVAAVRKAAPNADVVVPEYLTPYTFC